MDRLSLRRFFFRSSSGRSRSPTFVIAVNVRKWCRKPCQTYRAAIASRKTNDPPVCKRLQGCASTRSPYMNLAHGCLCLKRKVIPGEQPSKYLRSNCVKVRGLRPPVTAEISAWLLIKQKALRSSALGRRSIPPFFVRCGVTTQETPPWCYPSAFKTPEMEAPFRD